MFCHSWGKLPVTLGLMTTQLLYYDSFNIYSMNVYFWTNDKFKDLIQDTPTCCNKPLMRDIYHVL